MNTIKNTWLTLAFAVCAVGAASAEGFGFHGGGGKHPSPTEIFQKMDTDGDGMISHQEMFEMHKARFEKHFSSMDADKSGDLTAEEMRAAKERMRTRMKSRMHEWQARPAAE
ncbi:MAG: EF-hand domain-containing protein [Alphaproteobacteria bacterium]|nr:EF-hand domain-containing protein [Alphaproteobacteria bacterium]MDD9920368.1 EF-hand domain-containing protein [Alphaproteobacteria bacterium]